MKAIAELGANRTKGIRHAFQQARLQNGRYNARHPDAWLQIILLYAYGDRVRHRLQLPHRQLPRVGSTSVILARLPLRTIGAASQHFRTVVRGDRMRAVRFTVRIAWMS